MNMNVYQRKDGRFEGRITTEITNGKRKYKAFFGRTIEEVRKKMAEFRSFSIIAPDINPTFSRVFSEWFYSMNHLQGKNLSVVGLPNLDETVYCLYGMRAGAEIKKAAMYPQRIVYRDKSFYLNTYKNEVLQMIQTWLISSQLEQAVGRARLLRENCTVIVYAGFPVEQSEYREKSFIQNAK